MTLPPGFVKEGIILEEIGEMVAHVLKGSLPSQLPVEIPKTLKVSVNPTTEKQLNLTCPLSFTPPE